MIQHKYNTFIRDMIQLCYNNLWDDMLFTHRLFFHPHPTDTEEDAAFAQFYSVSFPQQRVYAGCIRSYMEPNIGIWVRIDTLVRLAEECPICMRRVVCIWPCKCTAGVCEICFLRCFVRGRACPFCRRPTHANYAPQLPTRFLKRILDVLYANLDLPD